MTATKPYRLWVMEGGKPTLLGHYEDKGLARRAWGPHRQAAIGRDGAILETKSGAVAALVGKMRAAEEAYHRAHPVSETLTLVSPGPDVRRGDALVAGDEDDEDDSDEDGDEGDVEAPADADGYSEGQILDCGVRGCEHRAKVPRLGTKARKIMPDFCGSHRTRARAGALKLGVAQEVAAMLLRTHGQITRGLVEAEQPAPQPETPMAQPETPPPQHEPVLGAPTAANVNVTVASVANVRVQAVDRHGDELVLSLRLPVVHTESAADRFVEERGGLAVVQEQLALVERAGGVRDLRRLLTLIEQHGGLDKVDSFLFHAAMFAKAVA
ncbi:MAG: hypothetical protein JNK72_00205 [Myxococcales bacterium]|nr:hypothetical protein [Myxococcales bacterium]